MNILPKAVIAAAFALCCPAVVGAQGSADQFLLGTWKLNVAESDSGGPRPHNGQMRTYAAMAGVIKMSVTNQAPNGEQGMEESTFRLDGRPYPITGVALYDHIAVTRLGDLSAHVDLTSAGKIVGSYDIIEASDLKTMRLVIELQSAERPTAVHQLLIYDRQ